MFTINVDTAVSGIQYPVEIQQFSTLEEVEEHFQKLGENPPDAILKVVNTYQEAQAKQGGKEGPRKLLRAGAATDAPEVLEAIAKHQEHAAAFVIGVPRASVGGVTKAKRADLGTELVKYRQEHGRYPTDEELEAIAEGLGISA